jgi:hypothetical protein
MNQKPIVLYLQMKGMALDAIHNGLVCTLGITGSDEGQISDSVDYQDRYGSPFMELTDGSMPDCLKVVDLVPVGHSPRICESLVSDIWA